MAKRQVVAKANITSALANKTISTILKEELKTSSRQRQKIIRTKGIRLDNRIVHSETKVKVGQVLEVSLPATEQVKVAMRPLPIDILYEDDSLLVVNKAAGVVLHHSKPGQKHISLVEGIAYLYKEKGITLTPRPVHRLDRNASGIVIFAKSAIVQQRLSEIWSSIIKVYWVQVEGIIDQAGEICTPINGKEARTKYTPLEVNGQITTLRVQIFTGRTHQIRIHLAQIGHPIIGDYRYGFEGKKDVKHRLELHCWQIIFSHPVTQKLIEVLAPIPNKR